MSIPSGPYRASYDFSRHKRRNPDMTVTAPSGTVCIVPRYGDQKRQEAAAAMLAASLDMLNSLKAARPALVDAGALVALASVDLAIAKAEGR